MFEAVNSYVCNILQFFSFPWDLFYQLDMSKTNNENSNHSSVCTKKFLLSLYCQEMGFRKHGILFVSHQV